MNNIASRVGVVVGVAMAAMTLFGIGTSAADPYAGKTYADVSAAIAGKGGNPVISTIVGSQVPTDQCIVESWHKASYVSKDNFDHDKKRYLLALNCSAKLAHGGLPGNSLASAAGRAEKAIETRATAYNDNPTRCAKNLDSCQRFCVKYGLCSKDVTALF
jgi:hypothetical protein